MLQDNKDCKSSVFKWAEMIAVHDILGFIVNEMAPSSGSRSESIWGSFI